uniref:RNA polymerase I subunit E n=1 Tax=Zonotrichia albicollis TaxID=44394 RepID=A0A8D2MMB9_ZONAL
SPGELLPSSWGTPGNGSQCCCFPSALPKGLSWFPSALSRISLLPQVSETERLCYVGHNFGSQVMRCNSLCRYFVGVLDKSSGQMDVYNAEMFNMQPLLSGEGNISAFLPPCHEDAQRPEHVYRFEDSIFSLSPCPSQQQLNSPSLSCSLCSFVLEELKFLPTDEKSRDHKARCLWFLDTLIKFSQQKVIKKKHPMGPECPHIISKKLMKNFTSLTYNNGSIQNLISASMKAKITAYAIALALHINNFQTDLTVLQNDLKLSESRILDIAKALRLKVSKAKGVPGLENDQSHKLGTLSLPLPTQKAPEGQRKRKKMS